MGSCLFRFLLVIGPGVAAGADLPPTADRGQRNTPPAYTISTFAGGSFSGDGGPASAALLSQPEGVAVDLQGNVYVADANDHRVRCIAPGGAIRTVAGDGVAGFAGDGGDALLARLNSPYGVAIDGRGNLYIADLGNGRVRMVAPGGRIRTVAGGGKISPGGDGDGSPATAVALSQPRNLAVDRDGTLYVSDFAAHRVYRISPEGTLVTVAGTGRSGFSGDGLLGSSASISYPAGVAVDGADILYIADSGNRCIRRVYQGRISTLGDGHRPLPFTTPAGLAVDRENNLYLADVGAGFVYRISPAGSLRVLGGGARDVAVDSAGNLFVSTGGTLKRFSPSGAAATIAGGAAALSWGDGSHASSARLNRPSALARDSAGNVYIAEAGAHRIRKVDTSGRITTMAGSGERGSSDDSLATRCRFDSPAGIALDASGNLYVADAGNDAIRRVNGSGCTTVSVVGLSRPGAVAMDSAGNVYVADTGNSRIGVLGWDGRFTVIVQGDRDAYNSGNSAGAVLRLTEVRGLHVDAGGDLYFSDAAAGAVYRRERSGTIVQIAAGLRGPTGIAASPDGELLIAESAGQRLDMLDREGVKWPLAGDGTPGFEGDGASALLARLQQPSAVLPLPDGSLLIADTGNNRVRTLSPGAASEVELPPQVRVLHGASFAGQAVAPGQIVSIFGGGLGPPEGVMGALKDGALETMVAGTEVFFGGRAAPLFYVQDRQVNAQVPYGVAGKETVDLLVLRGGVTVGQAALRTARSSPGVLTGTPGRALAVNDDGTLNSDAQPAPRESVVTFYVTGEGMTTPDGVEGRPAVEPYPRPMLPVAVEIGGYAAEALYAGAAPGLIGLMQVNARVPGGFAPAGRVSLAVRVGETRSQAGVSIAVR
ncbi:MAG: hypothetical protein HYZ57_12905 [Acidobacteria bacterium]|nr:hypothetical protein [Acidobacteriota bacterium]